MGEEWADTNPDREAFRDGWVPHPDVAEGEEQAGSWAGRRSWRLRGEESTHLRAVEKLSVHPGVELRAAAR